jgi:hypothetical protein
MMQVLTELAKNLGLFMSPDFGKQSELTCSVPALPA